MTVEIIQIEIVYLFHVEFNPRGIMLNICINAGTVSSSTANAI